MNTNILYRISCAARATGVKRTTIQAAVGRGEIAAEHTGCGMPLVTLRDITRWAKKTRPLGRKPG